MMDQTKNKSICPYAFKATMVTVDGTVRPCCRFNDLPKERVKVDENNSVTDIFHSDYYENIRKKMLAGEKLSACRRCYKEEEAGQQSMRNSGYLITSKSTNVRLEYIETESGRHCNLKCRSCDPTISTGWNEDLKKSDWLMEYFDYNNKRKKELELNYYNDSLEYLTKEECLKLKRLKVTGGEPFLSRSFLKFVDNLDKWNLAQNIKIEVYTNTSFLPKEKFIKSLLKFDRLELHMSIDSVGKRNDYIRSGSDWKTVESVAEYWIKLASKNKQKIQLMMATTVSLFNVLTLDELLDWTSQKIKKYNTVVWNHFTYVHNPKYMCVYNQPKHIKQKMLQIINDKFKDKKLTYMQKRQVNKLLKIIELSTPTSISAKKDFRHITENIDSVRNEDWKQIFPEVFKLLTG